MTRSDWLELIGGTIGMVSVIAILEELEPLPVTMQIAPVAFAIGMVVGFLEGRWRG